MIKEIIDLGDSSKFNMEDFYYKKFCNQVAKNETRAERAVFATDWQRFLWAFILGIYVGKKTPIENKTKSPPFGMDVFKNRTKIIKIMIALTIQEEYKDNPEKLKTDFEKTSLSGENLGKQLKIAIEEYANTGFAALDMRGKDKPGYIENLDYIVEDILSDKGW